MVGQIISHYKVLGKLGEGGMGVVYKAQDIKLHRDVAIKFLPKRHSMDALERERFFQEARAASALNHPNICIIHEIEEANDEIFLVMEYVDGVTLREWNRRRSEKKGEDEKAHEQEVTGIAIQIAEGLGKAHEKGIVHRDVKAENIMLTNDGRVKIMDFGLAKLKGAIPLTKAGSTVGTAAYMSPEQARGMDIDQRSDIFSFGVLLYEMAAGQLPFRAEHDAALLYEIVNVSPPSLRDVRGGINPELDHIVMKCLEKDREDRYPSMQGVLVDLRRHKRTLEQKPVEHKTAYTPLTSPKRGRALQSLAVLPFTNVGRDPENEYLSDGITESLINSLSQLPKLRVTARTTAFRYKGREVDPPEVGRELQVHTLLTGRVIHRGNTLNIQAELVNALDGTQMWGEQYNRTVSDIFVVQEEIAKQIAQKLQFRLTGEIKNRLLKRHTQSTEAYQLYLQGRYFWNKRTLEGFMRGIQYFEQALRVDPSYALAYAGLADSYNLLGTYNLLPPGEAYPKAKAAATKALALDDTLAEAHTSLASVHMNYEWNWTMAEKEFKRAIDLNGNYATAHHWYAVGYLSMVGRHEEAIAEMERARELDPLSLPINRNLGDIYFHLRRHDDVVQHSLRTLEMDPNFFPAHVSLARAYEQKKMYDEAIAEYEKAVALSGDKSIIAGLGRTYAALGKRDEALKIINELIALSKNQYVSSDSIGAIYAALGEKDTAFEWLQKAYDEHSGGLISLKVEPVWDPLRSDPRFTSFLKKMKLEE